ncbi:YecA family protein [Virgibacillus xinjiangensis]|uniref:YecA family protein n=1 Tax=Virgibacillus xinjiangensis TaxID=393090 RepID=A0ABV7CXF5_9BACI
MSKIERNKPCPCGSGKKHKKCCGSPQAEKADRLQKLDAELNRFHEDLLSFSTNKHQKAIQHQIDHYKQVDMDEGTADLYDAGLVQWVILHAPLLKNYQTIYQEFYQRHAASVSPAAKDKLAVWPETAPSVYEVVEANQQDGSMTTIRDIHSEKTYQTPISPDDYVEGTLLIGTLVSFGTYDYFLHTIIKLYRPDRDKLKQLLTDYSEKTGGLLDHFPDFLAEALVVGVNRFEWSKPNHEEVAQQFTDQMVDKDMDDELILEGISLWHEYCRQENPTLKKLESYAAAMDYLVQKKFLKQPASQKQIAEEYHVSLSSVSTNYRKLNSVLSEEAVPAGS